MVFIVAVHKRLFKTVQWKGMWSDFTWFYWVVGIVEGVTRRGSECVYVCVCMYVCLVLGMCVRQRRKTTEKETETATRRDRQNPDNTIIGGKETEGGRIRVGCLAVVVPHRKTHRAVIVP